MPVENDPNPPVVLEPPKGELFPPPPNIDVVLAVVTAVELPNKEVFVLLPPNMLLPDPPKTFLDAESDEGLEPSPLKNPPLPPKILPPLAVVALDLSSELPPKTEEEAEVALVFSEFLKELPPKIEVDEAALLAVVVKLEFPPKELAPKMELQVTAVVLAGIEDG